MIQTHPFNKGIENLKRQGLNLFSTLAIKKLPENIQTQLHKANIEVSEKSHLILIGNAGTRLWDRISPLPADQADPIDYFSIQAAKSFANECLGGIQFRILYPGPTMVPLQQLGELVGWHHPSPFGVGVNSQWGPWFAYRCLLLVNTELPMITSDLGPSPCPDCIDKTCVKHCPAQAIYFNEQINLTKCARFRLKQDSPCADRCLARMSCPVAADKKYPREQIQYHYRLSLETLRHYYN